MSECYLRSKGKLTKLGEKNISLKMDRTAEFMATRKASSATVLKSAHAEYKVILVRGDHDHQLTDH